MRRNLPPLVLCVIPAAALIVILPLLLHGCSCGHDFDFHLVSWMEAAAQFDAGTLHPSWAFSPAWNVGEPRFVFYPPLSWTLGALLGRAIPWNAVPIVYTWLALAASGFAMLHLARELLPESVSGPGPIIASALYLANPYMILTAYERTAYAELLAAAWIPLLLAAILRERVTISRIAIPVALLWLTNAPAAVMGCYSLALLAAIRIIQTYRAERRISPRAALEATLALAARITAGTTLGLGIAAFYIVPAAYERRWVQIAMATIPGMRVEDNFLFHHTGDGPHDEVLHTASIVAVLIFAAALLLSTVILRSRRSAATRTSAAALAILAACIGLLLTPVSAVVWRIAPELTFLQFPWRFVAVLATVAGASAALAIPRWMIAPPKLVFVCLLLTATMGLPAAWHFQQKCDDEDTVDARLAVFTHHRGTDPTDEYTPTQADNDALAHANPPFWSAAEDDAPAPPNPSEAGPVPQHFTVDLPRPQTLILNLRDYPAWQIRRDGSLVTDRAERADGLIAFPMPAGRSHIDIAYVATPDQRFGEGITAVSLLALMALYLPGLRAPSRIIGH